MKANQAEVKEPVVQVQNQASLCDDSVEEIIATLGANY